MRNILIPLVIIACLIAGVYMLRFKKENYAHYEFVKEYQTRVVVGGVVGLADKIYAVGDVIEGQQTADGIKVRIAKSSAINRGKPSSNSYQEFITIPTEYLKATDAPLFILDVFLVRKNVALCNEEIKPELETFYKGYSGGGNAGIAVPESLFYKCLETKMEVTDQVRDYVILHASSATPPFILN